MDLYRDLASPTDATWPDRARMTRSMDTLDTTYTSPLVLADKLISLAQAAHLAGYVQCAEQVLMAAFGVLDDAADRVSNA